MAEDQNTMEKRQDTPEEAYIRRPNMTTEDELRIARERFNVIFQNTTVSVWDYYFETKQLVQPTRSQALHGFDSVIENVPDSLIESGFVHPDSATAFRAMYDELFAGKERAEGVFRVQTADRTGYWYEHIRYHTLFNEKGTPYAAVGMSTDVTDEVELQEKVQSDALTGLLNKKAFEERAKNMLSRFPEQTHILINLDLDNFKEINDTYGHDAGDEMLCTVAACIDRKRKAFSSSALAARAGGDEFVILLNDTSEDTAATFARSLLDELRCPTADGVHLTCSMGLSIYPKDGDTLKRLTLAADRALYYVKRQDKNAFSFYGDSNADSTLQMQRRQQFLSDNISGGMIGGYLEPDFPLYFIDDSLLSWLGYDSQEEFSASIHGSNINGVHPDDAGIVASEIERQLAAGNRYVIDHRIRKKDGNYIWVHAVGEKITTPDGREAITSACYDISAEKEHSELLGNVLSGLEAQVALYRVESDTVLKLLKNSRNVMQMAHYSDDEYRELCHEDALDFVYGQDREQVRLAVARCLQDDATVTEHFRLQDKQNQYTWVTGMVSPMGSDAGMPVVRVVFMPISIQSELQMQLLDSDYIGVYAIDDATGEIYYANKAGLRMYGIPETTAIAGKACHEVLYGLESACPHCWRKTTSDNVPIVHTQNGKSISIEVQKRNWNGRHIAVIYCRDVTEQQILQEEMRRRNEQLSVILKAVPGGLKCSRDDETYSYVFVSEEVAALFGYTPEEYLSATNGSAVGAVYPPDLPRVLEGLEEDFAKGPDYAQKYRIRCKDGSLKWILDCGRRMQDAQGNHVFNSLYLDITEAEEAGQEALQQHELLTSVYNSIPCGILRLEYVGDHYELLTINSAAWRLTTGQDTEQPSDFWYNGMAKTLLTEDRHLVEESYERLRRPGDRDEVDYRVKWLDGSIHILHRSSFLISAKDDRRLFQCIFVDITESKALQDALEEARVANLAKTDFLSRMSHDIRTPLNAILNLNRLMSEELDNPQKLQEDMNKIDVAGEFLLQLINDVLDISRIETGQLELKPGVYTYATFLNYIRGIITPLCEDKDITFELEEGPTALDIYMDRARFHQIFFNLLSNAVKFTPPGGVVSFATCNNVVHDGILTCDFVVSDTGCGMSKETIEHAFEPFVRGNSTDAYVGSGLGLAICKQILDKMGGTIKIESEEGKGTTITVHMDLPIATEEQRQRDHTEIDTSYHGNPASLKVEDRRILIVEDNAINAEILRRILEKSEIQTEHACNGQEAVDAIRYHDSDYFQMILMDIRMPVMDGIEATKQIRQMENEMKRNIPIIAITANAFESDVEECRTAGMNSCLAKPISPQKLNEMIATYIRLEN